MPRRAPFVLALLFLLSGAWGAVTSEVSRNDYVGTGSLATYAWTFPVKAVTELRVITQDADGQDVELSAGADYSTSALSATGTGSITLTAGNLTNGYKLSIQRGIPYTQTVTPGAAYNAATIAGALDRLQHQITRLKGDVDRAIKIPYLEAGGDSVVKLDDNATNRANQTLVFDSSGNASVGAVTNATASVFGQSLIDDTTASEARATLGLTNLYGAVFNVKDYGAVGNGVADDTTAIASAITAAASAGGRVFIPPGTFIVTNEIPLASNVHVFGAGPASVLKCGADGVLGVLYALSISHWSVSNLAIDGGGQTSNVSTGYKQCQGIRIDACTYWTIQGVSVYKCGIKNAAAPSTDSGHAGMGIVATALSGECAYGVIRDCRVRLIAGGGGSNGDGISISGYGSTLNLSHDISIEDCWVSTVGRHCYSVSGAAASGLPRNITIRKCYAEKSGLDGVDIEDATRTTVDDCRFSTCGNDQTFYDPATVYGSTYRLLAAIAVNSTDCVDLTISNCKSSGSYYGLSWSNSTNLKIDGCTFETSTREDLFMGGSQCPVSLIVSRCKFLSTAQNMQITYVSADNKELYSFDSCTFTKMVSIGDSYDVKFRSCIFLAGVQFAGSTIERPSFLDCNFEDFSGSAVTHSGLSQNVRGAMFRGCRFVGAGNMVNGISNQYRCALGWTIEGCEFIGLTGAGITNSNGDGQACYASITGNTFRSCASGISLTQAVINGVIANNTFSSITGYCIEILNVAAGANLNQMTITGNVAGASVTNGLRITLTTGAWDYCIVALNNFHTPSGTKWTLPAGNAGGVTANNITT